jgi:hypothetical protein
VKGSKSSKRRALFGFIIIILILLASILGYIWYVEIQDNNKKDGFIYISQGSDDRLIKPSDLQYLGAFRLPYFEGNQSWSWGGTGITYYPAGDPDNTDDHPGSLYGISHDHSMYISEFDIPEPVISSNLADLPTANTLQNFTNVRDGVGNLTFLFGNADIPYAGIAYLPAQAPQVSDKLYYCWGAHFQEEEQNLTSHMWSEFDFTNTTGAWRIGNSPLELYRTNDYMCQIPANFSDGQITTEGMYLGTGRFREGGWGGQGPNFYAIAPWQDGNPPPNGTELTAIQLLGYSSTHPEGYDYEGGHIMKNYHDSDEWSGASWLIKESKQALIFVGTKGQGDCWYGYSDGTIYTEEDPPDIPAYPHNNRGFWSSSFDAEIIFYNPSELAAVANGTMEPYEPQPYASLNLDQYLYNIDKMDHDDFPEDRNMNRLGGCTFDRENGNLYVVEYRGEPFGEGWNDDNAVIHVFKIS